ncbi:MAG: DUF1963 domain-containing protein [Oscillospiraceae bacterium]|nr:DUF1963 domain-containing protein [Oscillospiraceae bacterium]
MRTLNDLYQALLRRHIAAEYDALTHNVQVWQDMLQIEVTEQKQVLLRLEGQTFPMETGSFREAFAFITGVMDGQIRVRREDCRTLQVRSTADWTKQGGGKVTNILCILIGLLLGLFSGIMGITLGGTLLGELPHGLDADQQELAATLPLYLSGAAAGLVLLIRGIRGRKHRLSAALLVPGILITGFAVTEIVMGWIMHYAERLDESIDDTIGLSVVMAFVLLLGVLLIACAFWKKAQDEKEQQTHPKVMTLRRAPHVPSKEDLERIGAWIREKTAEPCFYIRPAFEAPVSLTGSKIGGLPYWDNTRPYPVGNDGEKMALLAQFNLADFPPNDKLPAQGLLQFFIEPTEMQGLESVNDRSLHTSQVVYHPFPIGSVPEESVKALGIPESGEQYAESFPVCGSFAVRIEAGETKLSRFAPRANELMHEAAAALGIAMDETLAYSEVFRNNTYDGSRFFGRAAVADMGHPAQYDTLLLQIVPTWDSRGDCGVEWEGENSGMFFIRSDALAVGDFSDVFYTRSE